MSFLSGIFKKKIDPLKALDDLNLGSDDLNQQQNAPSQYVGQQPEMFDPYNGQQQTSNRFTQDLTQQNSDFMNTNRVDTQSQRFDSFGNPMRQEMKQDITSSMPSNMQAPQQQSVDMAKELEIIMAKLDAIRAEVSNTNHRLDILETRRNQTQQKRYF